MEHALTVRGADGLAIVPSAVAAWADPIDPSRIGAAELAALLRPLGDLVDATVRAAAQSRHTARAYRTAIGLFLTYLEAERGERAPAAWRPFAQAYAVPVRNTQRTEWTYPAPAAVLRMVDKPLVDGFRGWLADAGHGQSPNTLTQRVNAVRTFLAIARDAGALTESQGVALGLKPYHARQTRDEKPVGRRLTRGEVRALREAPNPLTVKGKRDLAMIDCMLYAGLRREEVASLDGTDFGQDGGRWWIVFEGKGGRTRKLKMDDVLFATLTAWLRTAGLELGRPGCLFRSVNKGGTIGEACVNASVVGRIVAELGAAAGLAERGKNELGAHDLRRTCARNAYDNGASLLQVQRMLGHSDPKTTARYIGSEDNDGDTAIDYVRY